MKKISGSDYCELGKLFYDYFSDKKIEVTVDSNKEDLEMELERITGLIDYIKVKKTKLSE
ncbi:MAG: hypothetical protein HQL29_00830 [Candidatus Omnitrophica bacterium]|nr:hypothetical protein [Candidatus Omnitrophota bacterium]